MSRSFSNTKLVSSFVVDQISIVLTRRGYVASSYRAVSESKRGGAMSNMMLKKGGEEGNKTTTTSWVPDPKTGVYRPENQGSDATDATELKEVLLANQISRH
ncbi:hypothetical protein LIER_07892 [Lithospermum erythrorhizon]|uniref:Late embryogenesis abundant protein n=1 Tax=Lithospermum erythrorhizon TaxID=34254 RepID=A0AAV3PBD7_LITER